jgi:uncharacterized protein (DUF2141 family)
VIGLLFLVAAGAERPTLWIEVEGLRNERGVVQLALFRTAEGYPQRVERAARTRTVSPADARRVSFDDLEPGVWALAVLHDENANGRLDTNLFGIPAEGIGASREATRRMGEPRFDDASFVLDDDDLTIDVTLRYWL